MVECSEIRITFNKHSNYFVSSDRVAITAITGLVTSIQAIVHLYLKLMD